MLGNGSLLTDGSLCGWVGSDLMVQAGAIVQWRHRCHKLKRCCRHRSCVPTQLLRPLLLLLGRPARRSSLLMSCPTMSTHCASLLLLLAFNASPASCEGPPSPNPAACLQATETASVAAGGERPRAQAQQPPHTRQTSRHVQRCMPGPTYSMRNNAVKAEHCSSTPTCDAAVHVQHIVDLSLKVGGRVIALQRRQ